MAGKMGLIIEIVYVTFLTKNETNDGIQNKKKMIAFKMKAIDFC
jgi:hypothetical protein